MGKLVSLTYPLRLRLIKLLSPSFYMRAIFPHRSMIDYVSRNLEGDLIGLELGVGAGLNAVNMLKTLSIETLYLVDPYRPYIQSGKEVTGHVGEEGLALERLRPYWDKIRFIRKDSAHAFPLLPENLDFIYIDANHSYSHVKKDIENYWVRVRYGGILGGHDFSPDYLGLVRAVLNFSRERDLKLMGGYGDWFIVKE